MTTEEKLKELILSRYHSIREFTFAIDMPYTTLDSIFRRGIGNSGVNNVIKICKALRISTDDLANGEIVPIAAPEPKHIEVVDVLDEIKERLSDSETVTLNGKPIDQSGIESIIDAMDVGVEMVKRKNKA